MRSIKKEISISGKGLMSGLDCNVNIFPSSEKGIKFYLSSAKTPVMASYKNVVSADNCVVLANKDGAKVILVEHFLAACAFAGIDSLDVCLDSPELPILDGSSLEWHKNLIEAGSANDAEINRVAFDKPVSISDGKTDLAIIPAEDFRITCCVDFDHPQLKNRCVFFNLEQDAKQILQSRTFGYLKDLEKFQQSGMALGVTIENTVGLTEDGYTTDLRSEFEPAKHKILDLIGDLYLTGINPLALNAHIFAKESGHRTHIEFAEAIAKEIEQKVC